MPQPTTTGGNLMSYPSTVDTNSIAPLYLAPLGIENATATAAITAGAAYFMFAELRAPITLSKMRLTLSGSPTGNIDMGVYDATGTSGGPGTMLGHTGAIAAVTGVFTQNLTANLLLSPGQYWLAVLDTVADTYNVRQGSTGVQPVVRTTATNLTVLPSTSGAVADNNTFIGIMGLILNGFS